MGIISNSNFEQAIKGRNKNVSFSGARWVLWDLTHLVSGSNTVMAVL
jgi:hypothetical protein